MKLLDRYIGTYVIGGTLVALLVLLVVFSIIAFIDDLGHIGRGEYTMVRALEHLALTTPRRAFNLFPLAGVLGTLMGLGVLASNLELTAIRTAGVSVARIAAAAMKAAAVLAAAAVLIGEVLAPAAEQFAEQRRSIALAESVALQTANGFWARDGDSFINIREVLPGNRMGRVVIYEFDDERRLRVITRADRAEFSDGQWTLDGIRQTNLYGERAERVEVDRAVWESLFEPELVSVVAVKPESLSALGLYRYLGYLRSNGLSTQRFELALWTKLIYPLSTAVMIFLALPMVLGRLRAVGVGQRVMVGALLGIGFHIIHQASGHVGLVYGMNPFLSAVLPTLGFLGVGVWLMRRVR